MARCAFAWGINSNAHFETMADFAEGKKETLRSCKGDQVAIERCSGESNDAEKHILFVEYSLLFCFFILFAMQNSRQKAACKGE